MFTDADPIFTIGWLIWVAGFLGFEGYALWDAYQKRKKDPDYYPGMLSQHIWLWFGTKKGTKPDAWAWTRRGTLALFLLWVNLHLLSGGRIV